MKTSELFSSFLKKYVFDDEFIDEAGYYSKENPTIKNVVLLKDSYTLDLEPSKNYFISLSKFGDSFEYPTLTLSSVIDDKHQENQIILFYQSGSIVDDSSITCSNVDFTNGGIYSLDYERFNDSSFLSLREFVPFSEIGNDAFGSKHILSSYIKDMLIKIKFPDFKYNNTDYIDYKPNSYARLIDDPIISSAFLHLSGGLDKLPSRSFSYIMVM